MRSGPPRSSRYRRGSLAAVAAISLASGLMLAGGQASGAAAIQRVDNPYAGAKVYVNPDWSAKAAAESGGAAIANQPTGVWMDRIAAINGTSGARGLRSHLDTALSQGAKTIQIVIYDLPGRDCSALASNGELGPTEIDRYQTEYIDPIAAIEHDSKYAGLNIVNVIEIDSLPNLITNTSGRPTATPQCDTMKANGNYQKGVGYAVGKLYADNVYNYIDAGHHGWIGWADNFQPTAQLIAQTVSQNGASPSQVAGFIANTANYSATTEPYFKIDDVVNGQKIRETTKWIDWNNYIDEQTFATDFRQALINAGLPSNIGGLIDTSRNGWGGSQRPTGPGPTNGTPDQYVDASRVDRRIHLGNWCNQSGAGLGERPKASPAAGLDAYVWIKPPGESDGSSTQIPNDEGKGFDQMCDPAYTGNPRNQYNLSGALPNAPLSGHWFSGQFQELVRNAYPAL